MKPQLRRPELTAADPIANMSAFLTQHKVKVRHEIGRGEAHPEWNPRPSDDIEDTETKEWRRAFAHVRSRSTVQ